MTFRKILAYMVAILISLGSTGGNLTVQAQGMTDIENHWAREQIESLVADGFISGYPDGTFDPNGLITRGEFITILTAAIGLEPELTAAFDDVFDHWSNQYIGAAVAYSLVDPETYYDASMGIFNFEPDKAITRGEMATFIVRAMGNDYEARKYEGSLDDFADSVQIPSNQKGYVESAVAEGIITGYPDGSFGADTPATRAEASVMIMRLLDTLKEDIALPLVGSEDIYNTYSKSVVKITVYDIDNNFLGTGSGFVIDQKGHIVTNYHVIDGAGHIDVEFISRETKEVHTIVNYDAAKDVAVIHAGQLSEDVVPVSVGNDRELRIGSRIYTIGYPLGQGLSITDGLISSDYYRFFGQDFLQVSAPISPGNSGGPLVDKYGRVIGIITMASTMNIQNMNYAVPISLVGEMLSEDRAMTMEAFAGRNTNFVDAYGVDILGQYIYGISKENGEKIYADDNYFDLQEVSSIGVEMMLTHEAVGGDNALDMELYLYDGDYDLYDSNYFRFALGDTGRTLVDVVYEPYYSYYIANGKYTVETYIMENLWVSEEVILSDNAGFGEFHMKGAALRLYNYDDYLESGVIEYKEDFVNSEISTIGMVHELTFEEIFENYDSFSC